MKKNKPSAGKVREKKSTEINTEEADTLLAILTTPSYQDAARKLGMTYEGLWRRMKKYPHIRERIDELPKHALTRLKLGSIRAAEEYISELDHHRVDIRQKAAGEVLDRVGVGKGPSTLQQFNVKGDMDLEFIGNESSTT